MPQLTQNVPQAAALPLLFAFGLLRSASLCAIFAWGACDAVASFQQLIQFRLALATILFANWSGRLRVKRPLDTKHREIERERDRKRERETAREMCV